MLSLITIQPRIMFPHTNDKKLFTTSALNIDDLNNWNTHLRCRRKGLGFTARLLKQMFFSNEYDSQKMLLLLVDQTTEEEHSRGIPPDVCRLIAEYLRSFRYLLQPQQHISYVVLGNGTNPISYGELDYQV